MAQSQCSSAFATRRRIRVVLNVAICQILVGEFPVAGLQQVPVDAVYNHLVGLQPRVRTPEQGVDILRRNHGFLRTLFLREENRKKEEGSRSCFSGKPSL